MCKEEINMSGWTEKEMNEGFVEQPQPEKAAPTTDMGRRQDLAGKTVRHNGYEYTYDELGYCKSKVKIQQEEA
jgi:hypothetical protein